MSLCSRRSARMSLILRQSCLDSFASESADSGYDEMVEKRHIPDVFSSKRNRRDSIVTPSKAQLVATVFGNEAAKIATASPGTESALLRSALEPVMGDELMMEIGGLGESLDSFAEAMNASQRNIDQLVDASVREEQQRIVNQIRLDSIGSSCCEASAGENPRENGTQKWIRPPKLFGQRQNCSLDFLCFITRVLGVSTPSDLNECDGSSHRRVCTIFLQDIVQIVDIAVGIFPCYLLSIPRFAGILLMVEI